MPRKALVIYCPSTYETVREMLKLAEVNHNDIVYDLGSGDGRILQIAAEEFDAYGVGIEVRKRLVDKSRRRIEKRGIGNRVKIIHGDFQEQDISPATVVTLYLTSSVNNMLKSKLEKELQKENARVVSNSFEVDGWELSKVGVRKYREFPTLENKIFLYHMKDVKKGKTNK